MPRNLIQPDALKQNEPLKWSTGIGTDVWEMFCACIDGDLDTVKRLVDRDPSLVRAHYEYRTPLSFAVRENQVAIAAFLLDRGADPRNFLQIARDRGYAEMEKLLSASTDGESVAAAIRTRDLDRVRALLDAKPELVNSSDLIHWAVMTRQLDMIDELLSRGADINARRADGARPIQLTNGDYGFRGWRDVPEDAPSPRDVLAHLRARGAYCDICTAAYIGDIARVRELLARDRSLANRPSDYVTYYACSGTPLRNAAGGGHVDIVRLLLDSGADPNLPEEHIAPRGHALHMAVCNGHREIVELLLARGAHANVEIESSADTLSAALRNDDQPMVDLLCAHGAARRVHLLAYYGDVRTAAAMFAANPQLADDPEALANAARGGQDAFVRLMLRYQPRLPERVSIGAKTRELTELLFAHGMTPHVPNWLHITALHHFAGNGDLENARLFLDRGARIDARDEEFRSTPLGWAARKGQQAMVDLLIERGAAVNLPDCPPWATPLAWARRRGHQPIVERLVQHGAH